MGDPLPMVSSTTGAMNSLLNKLTALLEAEPDNPMLDESMLAGLKKLNEVLDNFAQQRTTGALTKEWMLQVREVIYDMEDWVDGRFTLHSESAMDLWCSDVVEQAEEFKAQIQDALDRCIRYSLLDRESATDVGHADAEPSEVIVPIDGKLLYGQVPPYLEAVENQRKVIVEHLIGKEHHRKVVSIVGTRGIGKTALSMEIYRQLQGEFDCGAFIHVGYSTSVKKTLISILDQVKPNWRYDMDSRENNSCCTIGAWEEQKVIAKLWAILKKRRYFLVLDDMRSTWTWKRISCALPYNDQADDRILVTTCIKDVAESCCIHPRDVVHHMEDLGEVDSKTLFDSIISAPENNAVREVYDEMLKICSGIPLAITVAAGLLFWKSASLPLMSQMLDQYQSTPQGMRKILEISYVDLPLPMKSCFLYLSAFPENSPIKKDRLVRRWIAEGLITKRNEESLWKTGESYFNELIGRRLIQPAFDDEDDQPIGCTVHGVVIDFIVSLSTEENFITAGTKLKSELSSCVWVRRFCLNYSDVDEGNPCMASSSDQNSSVKNQADTWEMFHLSRVRSLAFCGNAGSMPDFEAFKLVRVLDLEDTKGLRNKQLESIGQLSLLRYLGLVGTDVTKIPEQIMALEQLTTLDLRRTIVRKLSAFRDKKLVSVLADELTALEGIEKMEKLEELSKVILGPAGLGSDHMAELVNKLRVLRMLGVRFSPFYVQNETGRLGVKGFLEEAAKSNLHSLSLHNFPHYLVDFLVDSWTHTRPPYLQKFELKIRGFVPPQKIASLMALTHLHIEVSEVEAQGVCALGSLPKLVLLKLHSDTSQRLTVSGKDGFPSLNVLWYECQRGGIKFDEGAMPQLRKLRLDFNVREIMCDFDFGMEHLNCLLQVRVTIDCKDNSTASEVEAHIRGQVSLNSNNPVLVLNRKGQCYNLKAAEDSVIEIHSVDEWITQIDPNKLAVIHFTAGWCGPSLAMVPVFSELANKNPNVIFLKVDVDEMETIAAQFHVTAMPTFLFMTGGEVTDRVVGALKEKLLERFDLQIALWMSRRP